MGGGEDNGNEEDGNSKKIEVDDGNDADDEVALAHEDTQHHSELYKFMFGDHNEDLLGKYSLLDLECHFLNLKSQWTIQFSLSLLLCFVEKRPSRLRLENEIE